MKPCYVSRAAAPQKEGPFDESYVLFQYAYGAYRPQDLVWTEGAPDWQTLEAAFGAKPTPASMAKVPVIPPASRFDNPFGAYGYIVMRLSCYAGRASRREFWMSFLGIVLLAVIASGVLTALAATGLLSESMVGSVARGVNIALVVTGLSVTTRRLHDMGMSGWWQLLRLLLVLGDIVILILCARKGDEGSNAYGDDPQG